MSVELKESIERIGKAFDSFKAENDLRLKEIEAKGNADPLLEEKVNRINAEITENKRLIKEMEILVARSELKGGGSNDLDKAKIEHAKAFEQFFRKGVDAGLAELQIKASLKSGSDPDVDH